MVKNGDERMYTFFSSLGLVSIYLSSADAFQEEA